MCVFRRGGGGRRGEVGALWVARGRGISKIFRYGFLHHISVGQMDQYLRRAGDPEGPLPSTAPPPPLRKTRGTP